MLPAIIPSIIAALPTLLIESRKLGEGIYRVLQDNRDQLPADQLAALDAVTVREDAAEEEFFRDVPKE